jgi:hypothetical protein
MYCQQLVGFDCLLLVLACHAAQDAEPVAIDALATCYDDNCRPPPMSYSHIAAYLDSAGAAAAAAAAAAEGQQPRTLAYSSSGLAYGSNSSTPQQQSTMQAQMQPTFMQQQFQQELVGPNSWQLLFDGLHAAPGITVTESQLDFGSCSRLSPCEPRSFTVNNTTNSKLLVSLLVPPWQDPLGAPGKTVQVFQVSAPLLIYIMIAAVHDIGC